MPGATARSHRSAQPIELTFEGDFYSPPTSCTASEPVGVNSGRLNAKGRLFTIDKLAFTEGDDGFPQVAAALTVSAYLYGSGLTAGAPAAPPATSRRRRPPLDRHDRDHDRHDGHDDDADTSRHRLRPSPDPRWGTPDGEEVDLKAKAKRQKIMAAGGAVLPVGILAIQVPKTMKMMNAEAPPQPRPATAPVALGPTRGAADAWFGGRSDTGRRDERRLDGLDPPCRQAPDNSSRSAGSRAATRSHSRSIRTRQRLHLQVRQREGAPVPAGTPVSTPGVVSSSPSGPVSSVVISVNGVEETVAIKGEFPADEPIFRLVSATTTTGEGRDRRCACVGRGDRDARQGRRPRS